MRLAAVSDLHYPESGADLPALAAAVRDARADALVLVGDAVSQYHPPLLTEVLTAFTDACPVRVFVPGNHELWSREGSTARLYEQSLPDLCEQHGWHYLDAGPVYVGEVAIVGNVGWYDYSLTDRVTFADVRVALGAEALKAMRGKSCPTMPLGALTDEHLAEKSLVVVPPPQWAEAGFKPALLRWNDARWVRLGVSDAAFTLDCARRLREHLRQAENRAERIVVAVHTAPFLEALPTPGNPVEALTRAYQGARVLGEAIAESRKVVLAVHGHRHRPGVHDVNGLPVINVTGRPDRGGSVVIRDV
ncbi:MAG: metallophosphoesterase family protein [Deltaproteobacteria bacterium]|nr:metallophosphoesterase family protein [Deltaproteobacteria bacterium]